MHLECAVPCGAGPFDPTESHHLCPCGAPLLARYDFDTIDAVSVKAALGGRPATMWRYHEALPPTGNTGPVSLGEGWTPLVRARRLGAALGMERLYVKDESANPTNSFKARGLSAAVTVAAPSRRHDAVRPVRWQRGKCAGRLCRLRRHQGEGLHAPGRQTAIYSGMRVVRRRRHPRRRADNRRRSHRGRNGRTTRVVRRVDSQGAVPRRRQEDDGV